MKTEPLELCMEIPFPQNEVDDAVKKRCGRVSTTLAPVVFLVIFKRDPWHTGRYLRADVYGRMRIRMT